MKSRTKKLFILGAIVFLFIFIYAAYEGYLFFSDSKLVKKIQQDMVSGMSEKALSECENLHYWRTTLCSSLRVAINVSSNQEIMPYACNDIALEYDGPWWLPMHQKYIAEMESRKRACITTILSRHNLG